MLLCYNCHISICVICYQYSFLDCFQIKMDQITKLVVLPLYPQFSISTSGSSLRILEEIFRYLVLLEPHYMSILFSLLFHQHRKNNFSMLCRKDEYLSNMQHTVIPSWYHREGYLKAMSKLISQELKRFKQPDEVLYLITYLRNLVYLVMIFGLL